MAQVKKTNVKGGKPASSSKSVNIYGSDGKAKGKVELPTVFQTPFRPDVIRRSVVSAQANRRQRYGPRKNSGMRHAVSTWGKGRGVSRVQRLKSGRRGAESPNNVGGRRAHPPKPEHSFEKKINIKERRLAKASALAATSVEDLVRSRGHRFKEGLTLPVIVTEDFESLDKARDVMAFLGKIGLDEDLLRAHEGIHVRAGRGKMRGRRFRKPRSLLLVVSDGSSVITGARNLPGVNVISPRGLNTEHLAPGGDPGRLLVITKNALSIMGGE